MWAPLYALTLSVGVAVALLRPELIEWIKLDANLTLGVACGCLGLSSSGERIKDLLGSSFGLGNLCFSLFISTFVWPALGLAAAVLALQHGAIPFGAVVGFALVAACPVGGPSNAVNVKNAGGSLESACLICLIGTPLALLTFPWCYKHFSLLLLDQPLPEAASLAAAADAAQLRAQLTSSLDVPASVMTSILYHALFATVLPMLGGLLVSSLVLPPRLGALARRHGPQAAASLIVLTCCPKTAAGAAYVREAGVPVVMGVAALHVAALVVGYLIPAGVGAPGWTCRTTAFQCSMRNPALGLGLAAALFHGSPALPLVAAPLVASVFVQNTLGAWMGAALCRSKPRLGITTVDGVSSQRSPQAFKAQSLEAVLRQPTFRRSSEAPAVHSKEE